MKIRYLRSRNRWIDLSAAGSVEGEGEQGFMLVGLIVAIFFILLVLSIAAPTVAKELKREREVEAMHRGNEYVRAIQLFYRKTQGYPASLEALEKTNNVRFLRQRYVDPMTGKADWRVIPVGQAKTTVKGFFGQPLAGLAPGLGAASSMASPGGTGTAVGGGGMGSAPGSASGGSFGGSSFGGASGGAGGFGSSSGSSGFGSSSGSSSFGSSSFGSSSGGAGSFGSSSAEGGSSGGGVGGSSAGVTGGSGSNTPGSNSSGPGGSGGMFGQSGSGTAGPFVGVGLPKAGDSIVVLNEQVSYQTWEFIYDPRIEQLKAKANLLGGGPASTDAGSLGSAAGMSSGVGGTGSSPSGFGSGSGTGSGSGFGSGSGPGGGTGSSGFGSSSFGSSGFGSSGAGSSGSTPQSTQAPQ